MRKEFYTGHLFDVYRYFGAHKEGENFIFRVFAPSAKGVCVFGEFSNWTEIPMYQEGQSGVYVSEPIPAKTGQLYKYCIYTANGGRVEHCDPYGFQMELRPGDCSILTDLYSYKFKDEKWMKNRTVGFDSPVNIYEIHAGSWRKKGEGQTDWYTYIELAKLLIPYVKKNHYTHIEMMPLSEHPFDGSWGYQNTGFFAPTARYGTPDELKKFVDECHQAGIGVIMDFVPVHFAVDYYGLKEFDGTCLYEYPNAAVGESEWGSCNFMHSRGEVRCFLQSAANYWLSEFHFDGIRMDAVSRLIYWQGDEARGVNGTTLDFLKVMNQGLKSLHPTAMLIAEDSTAYPGVTEPVWKGGLGFDYKWDLGWMHDTLEYFQTGPEYRSRDYHKLTFSMVYFWNERYMLEYCHDEVVHGKATILQKMYGDYEDKFPQARAMYMYMMIHPGKKLNFMGNEFGHPEWIDFPREGNGWSHKYARRQWDLVDNMDLKYHFLGDFDREMLELIRSVKNFQSTPIQKVWDNDGDQILAYMRKDLVFVFNFNPTKSFADYGFLVPKGEYEVVLNTDANRFGGFGLADDTIHHFTQFDPLYKKEKKEWLKLYIPARSAVVLKKVKKAK